MVFPSGKSAHGRTDARDAHAKTHRDATAATIAACGMLTLYRVDKNEATLSKAFKLVKDTLALCKTGRASARSGGIDMGKDGWETLLKVR
jgi:hypothetical protein